MPRTLTTPQVISQANQVFMAEIRLRVGRNGSLAPVADASEITYEVIYRDGATGALSRREEVTVRYSDAPANIRTAAQAFWNAVWARVQATLPPGVDTPEL